MASLYVNKITGIVARMPEPADVEESDGKAAALHVRRTLARMDEAKRWERVSESEAAEAEAAYEAKQESLRRPRGAAPTPVYVVNSEPKTPESETVTDGVRAAGGGWYEVVKGGEVVDKVRGKEAAEEVYETD